MEFNTNKCHLVRFGESKQKPFYQYKAMQFQRKVLGKIRRSLSANYDINEKAHKMPKLIADMKTAFMYEVEYMI